MESPSAFDAPEIPPRFRVLLYLGAELYVLGFVAPTSTSPQVVHPPRNPTIAQAVSLFWPVYSLPLEQLRRAASWSSFAALQFESVKDSIRSVRRYGTMDKLRLSRSVIEYISRDACLQSMAGAGHVDVSLEWEASIDVERYIVSNILPHPPYTPAHETPAPMRSHCRLVDYETRAMLVRPPTHFRRCNTMSQHVSTAATVQCHARC